MSTTIQLKRTPSGDRGRRLKWDLRFLKLAETVARWSRDPSTQCGAALVRADHTVISLGFNGFPRGVKDDEEVYLNRPMKYARVIHAEMAAILQAREPLDTATMYVWPLAPCDRCAAHLIQAGVKRIVSVYCLDEETRERWGDAHETAASMYAQAGVTLDLVTVSDV